MEYTPLNCSQYALLEACLNTLVTVGRTMTYAGLASILGFRSPRDVKMHELLGWSMQHDNGHGHPLRCALIVRKDTGLPGDEFWGLARRIGIRIPQGGEEQFHSEQLTRLGV